MRPPIWTLLAIPALAIMGWYIWTQPQVPMPEMPIEEEHLLSCTPQGADCVHSEVTPHYSIHVTYPKDAPNQNLIEQTLAAEINQFKTDLASMLDDSEKARLEQTGRKYEFAIEYKKFEGSGFTSYEFDVYVDTGGAHPNGYYKTLVIKGGEKVELADLFLPGVRYLDRLSTASFEQVSSELERRTGSPLTVDMEDTVRLGTSPSPEALQNFLIDGNELVILFPPYQVAAYAAGSFEARIPLSQLQDILK